MTRAAWFAGIALVALALIIPLAPAAFGVRMLTVDGGSMSPTYAVGDVIAVAPTDSVPPVGAVVVVEQAGDRYAHRVVEVDGDRMRLRGDANEVTDPGWIDRSDLAGVVTAHVGGPAALALVASTSLEGRIALVLLLALLVLFPMARRRTPVAPDAADIPEVVNR